MRVIVFDTETGGFNAETDRLLTIAAVPLVDGEVLPGREWKVKGPGVAHPAALAVNKIDLAKHDAEALAPQVVTWELYGFCSAFFSGWIELAGHNQAFDMPFLRKLWEQGSAMQFSKSFSSRMRCTMTLAQVLRDCGAADFPDVKLGTLARYYGVELGDAAHTALADATATAHVLNRMSQELRKAFAALEVDLP